MKSALVTADIRLRPAWHVAVPFALGAGMLGVIGLIGGHWPTLALSATLLAWGLWWALKARRGAQQFRAAIADALECLPSPGAGTAVRLGPAVLLQRPRRHGQLFWSREGFLWLTDEAAAGLPAGQQQVLPDLAPTLRFPFTRLGSLDHSCGMLSGDKLTIGQRDGDRARFALPNPAVYTFARQALAAATQGTGTVPADGG